MKFTVLALDYDGTIACDGILDADAGEAIQEARARGITVILVTGRILSDLKRVAGKLDFVDAVVAENGAVLVFPSSRSWLISRPPAPVFLEELRRRGISFNVGQCIVEADAEVAPRILEVIYELEQPLVLLYNRSRLMVLPQSISKATGLHHALTALRLSAHNAIGIGDAENDHELLAACEIGVAAGWGSPILQRQADDVLLFFPAVAWARSRSPLPLLVRALGYLGISVVATSLAVATCYYTGLDPSDPSYMFKRTVAFGLVLTPVLLLVESIWSRLAQTRREVEQRALGEERARRSAAEARWNSLESRLHPHFVFNTLASIRELLHHDARRADHMIQRFAELLRFSLDTPQNPLIPLEEEIRMVTAYLEIEQMRLGPRLAWDVYADPAGASVKVPSLCLLTLAENAIKHAISARRVGGRVSVTARLEEESLRLEVADDGPGFAGDNLPPGHGLDLLRERLLLVYGGGAALQVAARRPGVAVELLLPKLVQELTPNV